MSTIKFYKDSNGAFRLTDCTGKLAYINKGDIVSAYAENGVCSMIFSDEVYNRFTDLHNKNVAITDFVNASSAAYDEAGLNSVLSDFFVKSAGGISSGVEVVNALGYTPENAAKKGAAGGYAPLDSGSKVPAGYLPSSLEVGAINGTIGVSSNTAPSEKAVTDELKNYESIDLLFTKQCWLGLSGVEVNDSTWRSTDYIPVSFLKINKLFLYGHGSVGTICFYTKEKKFISSIHAATEGVYITGIPTYPDNAFFVRFTKRYDLNIKQQCILSIDYLGLYNYMVKYDYAFEGVFSINYAITAVSAGYIGTNGILGNSDVNWLNSGFLKILSTSNMYVDCMGHTAVNTISFYGSSYTYISGIRSSTNESPYTGSVSIPNGAVYYRISFPAQSFLPYYNRVLISDSLISLESRITSKIPSKGDALEFTSMRKMKLQPTDKVILYGTSISSTDYSWYKSSMESLTGASVYNGGYSGSSSAQLASNSYLQRIFDYAPRLIILELGANDSGSVGTVGTFDGTVVDEPVVSETNISNDYAGTYYIQAVSHVIRKIKAQYYNIRTRANLIGNETESEKEAKIDAVLKPVIVIVTPLPQKRNNLSDSFSIEANWLRKRQAIIECSKKYKIDCIDLYSKCGFDMSIEPYWTSPTDKITNNGVYFMDGLHPNKYGYQIISEIICAELGI